MAEIELVVKINEDTYKDIKRGKVYSSVRDVPLESVNAIANGTPIPDNATKGEVIMTLFPDEHDFETDFDEEWWNAPYQRGGKE